MLGSIGQQSDLPRSLDRPRQHTLMPSAGTGSTPRIDAPARRDILAQHADIFVINHFGFVSAKRADFASTRTASPAGA